MCCNTSGRLPLLFCRLDCPQRGGGTSGVSPAEATFILAVHTDVCFPIVVPVCVTIYATSRRSTYADFSVGGLAVIRVFRGCEEQRYEGTRPRSVTRDGGVPCEFVFFGLFRISLMSQAMNPVVHFRPPRPALTLLCWTLDESEALLGSMFPSGYPRTSLIVLDLAFSPPVRQPTFVGRFLRPTRNPRFLTIGHCAANICVVLDLQLLGGALKDIPSLLSCSLSSRCRPRVP